MTAFWIILGLLVVFIAVIVVRALLFRPPVEKEQSAEKIELDTAAATEHLAQMVRLRTVSSRNAELVDKSQFEAFQNLLPVLYPEVTKNCPREFIGETGMLYRWKGRQSANPTVLMAHYDVVTADGEGWEKPPFCGELDADSVLWGRGTLDTKGTLCGILEAAELLMKQGFVPQNDIYFSFSGDEEIMGPSAPAIVAELERRGVKPALVLDEGGAIVEKVFPGVKEKCAVIGIGEKGQMDLEFKVKSRGGHTSAPPVKNPVGTLCKAVVAAENHPFPAKLTPAAAQMFDTLGRYSGFGLKLVFANLWCFLPVLKLICAKSGGELNALMRTTCSFTMMQGSNAPNVFPPEAKMTANLRILRGETMDSATQYLKEVMNDSDVEISRVQGTDPSPYADISSPQWALVKSAVSETWPKVIVAPYMMVACSDSRHFCKICDNVLRFSAMELSKEERGRIHGLNERIPAEKIGKAAEFFARVIKKC